MQRSFRVAVVQPNPTVGDTESNRRRIESVVRGFDSDVVDLVVTPELSLIGYPPRDLLHREGVLEAQQDALDSLVELTASSPPIVVGVAAKSPASAGPPLQNTAVVLEDGDVRARYAKRLLPTYDIFDEHRYFDPGTEPVTVELGDRTVGLSICEDAWHDDRITGKRRHRTDPLGDLAEVGADLIVTLSASPFSLGKPSRRLERFSRHAERTGLPIVFANQVGANDDLIFDGSSLVVGSDGSVIEALPAFEPAVVTASPFDVDGSADDVTGPTQPDRAGQARRALALGIEDYLDKTGFSTVLIGMSGGIDSSVATALAVDALGPEQVHGVSLPAEVTGQQSIEDARAVATNLGISFDTVPISEGRQQLQSEIERCTDTVVEGLAAENIQARIRGDVLMTMANAKDALVLTPDNKSEAAVGYCTLYGDTVGALAPLGDCYKSLVYDLAREFNERPPVGTGSVIPKRIIDKPPTAELSTDQRDEDELPPYEQLDPVLRAYIHGEQTGAQLREQFADEVVDEALSRLTRSEFKRWQTPPTLRITDKAFGRGWRYPIAANYDAVLNR